MFNSITLYLILGLLATTLGFGYLSYHFYGDKVEAESALIQVIDANTGLQKSLNLRDLSCKIDDASVVEVEAEKKDLQTKTDVVSTKIEKLRLPLGKPPVAAKQETIKNEPLKETNVLPDDGLLSANLVRMLHEGYCAIESTDNLCRTP